MFLTFCAFLLVSAGFIRFNRVLRGVRDCSELIKRSKNEQKLMELLISHRPYSPLNQEGGVFSAHFRHKGEMSVCAEVSQHPRGNTGIRASFDQELTTFNCFFPLKGEHSSLRYPHKTGLNQGESTLRIVVPELSTPWRM